MSWQAARLKYVHTHMLTVMVASNQAMYDHGSLFLRAIMSSLRASSCLLSVKKKKNDFHIIASFNT